MGQVGIWVLRWNGITEDFQEECYNVPDIVQDEFQAVQGQIAWVARRGQDTSDHLASSFNQGTRPLPSELQFLSVLPVSHLG